MRIEHERRHAKRQDREPEVDQMGNPYGHGGVEQEQNIPHAHVDTRTSKSGIEDAERYPGSRETSSCRNITSTTKGQIT